MAWVVGLRQVQHDAGLRKPCYRVGWHLHCKAKDHSDQKIVDAVRGGSRSRRNGDWQDRRRQWCCRRHGGDGWCQRGRWHRCLVVLMRLLLDDVLTSRALVLPATQMRVKTAMWLGRNSIEVQHDVLSCIPPPTSMSDFRWLAGPCKCWPSATAFGG